MGTISVEIFAIPDYRAEVARLPTHSLRRMQKLIVRVEKIETRSKRYIMLSKRSLPSPYVWYFLKNFRFHAVCNADGRLRYWKCYTALCRKLDKMIQKVRKNFLIKTPICFITAISLQARWKSRVCEICMHVRV